jgi:hypothetical protein
MWLSMAAIHGRVSIFKLPYRKVGTRWRKGATASRAGGSSHHIIDAPILLTYVSYSDYNCHSDKEHKYPLCR